MLGCIAFTAAAAGWYYLLATRRAPPPLMQFWFGLSNVLVFLPTTLLIVLLDLLKHVGVPPYYVARICMVVMVLGFRLVCLANPQVTLKQSFVSGPDGKPASWFDAPRHNIAIAANHVSFWDVYVFLSACPLAYLVNVRTLMKSTLASLPVIGLIFTRVGSYPVYFKSDADGHFEVDKERQAAVQQKVDEHIIAGGNLALFPEGAMNKNPTTLQAFRFGTFATIFEHKMSLWYMVIVGNEKTWKRGAPLGGLPADIRVRSGYYPIDYNTKTSKDVAVELQAHMQKIYDDMIAEINAEAAASTGKRKAN